ncbi:MAG: helix-turn-helix domain-containing protein [Halobacteriota archaeon]
MNDTNGLIKRLTRFNLTEKEARCYLYLLQHGPKQPAELKKPLKLYREGIHRVLTSLMDKGMISRIVNGTSKYSAVDLPAALDTQLIAFQHELEQLEKSTRVLHARLNGHHFISADDGLTYKLPNSIDDQDAFVTSLIRFKLTEKEAQLYCHLLTHGPQRPTSLMHALKTYREDIYRRCTSLIDTGMIYKSAADPSLYIAAELVPALEGIVEHRESELRALEEVKGKLEELITIRPPLETGDVYTFKILKTLREVIAVTAQLIRSAEADLIFIAPPRMFNLFSMTGVLDECAKVIGHGVHVRGITDISQRNQGAAREHAEVGMHLRHVDQYRGITGVIVDGKQSISVIHADLNMSISPDANVTVLWSDSPEQATYLANTFELIWDRAMDTEERIHELSEQKRSPIETIASVY